MASSGCGETILAPTLAELAAEWQRIAEALHRDPGSAALAAEASRVGSAILTECARRGIPPLLVLATEGLG
jgi:hypothetical protein